MCGCPVILSPNPYFAEVIAKEQLGIDGIAWETSEREVACSLATVGRTAENYARTVQSFWTHPDQFIERTQAFAERRTQRENLNYGYMDANNIASPDRSPARSFLRMYVILKSLMEKRRRQRFALLPAGVKRYGLRHGI